MIRGVEAKVGVLVVFGVTVLQVAIGAATVSRSGSAVRISYPRTILVPWVMAILALVLVATSDDLSAADVGWAWPNGDGLDYLLALVAIVTLTVGAPVARRRLRNGSVRLDPGVAAIVPRTTVERWWAVALAVTAGVTEEILYRGLFVSAAVRLFHLPVVVAVTVSLAVFVVAHAYQGKRGMAGSLFLGLLYTLLFLISGSLLLPIVIHAVQNLFQLLWVLPAPRLANADAVRGG